LTKIAAFSTDWRFETIPGTRTKAATYGGTYFYRLAMPAMELAKHGYDTMLSFAVRTASDGHLQVMGTDRVWHDDCDVVIFQRWMHEDGESRAKRAIACGQIVVNDIDDHFWALPKTNLAYHTTNPATNPTFNRAHYRKMLEASSAIICSTAPLARFCERLGPPTFICRNAIDIERWQVHDPGRNGMVGWVGGIQWRANDLGQLCGILGPFLEQNGLPFYHGGDSEEKGVPKAWDQLGLNLNKTSVAANPLVHIADYPELWDPINLALVPLEKSDFNYSKSWLKGLEASACGIPFIASRTPEYELLGVGRLARTPREWRRHLDDLLDSEVRRAEGKANRARAEELSIANQVHQWLSVLSEIAPNREAVAA